MTYSLRRRVIECKLSVIALKKSVTIREFAVFFFNRVKEVTCGHSVEVNMSISHSGMTGTCVFTLVKWIRDPRVMCSLSRSES